MATKKSRAEARARRKIRVRKHVSGTADRPRLAVFRTTKHIYAQLIDDVAGETLAAASTLQVDSEGHKGNRDAAAMVGANIANKAKEAGITKVVFDRGGFLYHGRVQALADAAREAGLQF